CRKVPCDLSKVRHEHPLRANTLVAGRAQYRRRMDRREHDGRPFGFHLDTAGFHDAERATEQRLRGNRAQANYDLWLHQRDLMLEPWKAGANLSGVRCFVNTPLRARIFRLLAVLDRVSEVEVISIDARCVKGAVKYLPRRADERMPLSF